MILIRFKEYLKEQSINLEEVDIQNIRSWIVVLNKL